MSLSACGGGGDATAAGSFGIDVAVEGHELSGVQIAPGASSSLSVVAGQSIELDASEPVTWRLLVGGTAVGGSGTTVYYAGATITQTEVSDSRIVIDTSAQYSLPAPVPMTLVATSTLDAAQVATVHVLITN